MTWAKTKTLGAVVACALAITALAPAVLLDPIVLAFAQVRGRTALTNSPTSTGNASETTAPTAMSEMKAE